MQEEASRNQSTIRCLLQIKVAAEESKYGWDYKALCELLESGKTAQWPLVKVEGVMGMATLTDDEAQVRGEMRRLKKYFVALKENHFRSDPQFRILSMGMSGDYTMALEEGSNMVRIGSLLFSSSLA